MKNNPCSEIDVNGNPVPKLLTLEQKIRENLSLLKTKTVLLEEYLNLVIKAPLKEGDFCFHKEFGKGIIKHLSPGEHVPYNKLSEVGIGEALIVTISGERKVKYADIMPFNQMAEVLYESEKSD
jgi:hypothetical protein